MSSTLESARPVPTGIGVVSSPDLRHRHLFGLEGLSRDEIVEILDRTEHYRARFRADRRPGTELAGVTILNAFFEDSTRTRVSFEIAERRLGALAVGFATAGSSVSKGETLLDTIRTITSMGVDLVVFRHASAGSPAVIADQLGIGVINAGDGAHEHPTQGLVDLFTLRDAWQGRFEGRRLAIIGDIAHSRVARSALYGLSALGASVTLAGPATLMPAEVESLGCSVSENLDEALQGADGVMALRIQKERMERGLLPSLSEYAREWGLTPSRVELMKPEAVVMHPGPMNRGVEIAPEVADGPRSVVFDQTANGVAVRCAVLERCTAAMRRRARS